MVQLSSFFGVMPVRTGSLVISFFTIIYYIALFIVYLIIYNKKELNADKYTAFDIWMIFALIVHALKFVMGLFLFFAVKQEIPGLLMLWSFGFFAVNLLGAVFDIALIVLWSWWMLVPVIVSDFLDLKNLSESIIQNKTKDNLGNKVQWLKIKVLRYEKNTPGLIKYKYNIEDQEFLTIKMFKDQNPPNIPTELKPLYGNQLPISIAKKRDLLRLCSKNVIPQEYYGWYKSLPVHKSVKDRAPQPAVGSESEESSD